MKTPYLTGILLLIFLIVSCGKKQVCFDEYQFKLPVSIRAKSDTITVGDTIFINLNFSTKQKNLITNNDVNIPAKYFVHSIQVNKITDDSNSLFIEASYATGAYNQFTPIAVTGDISKSGWHNFYGDLTYKVLNDSLHGVYYLIANDTGTFVFTMVDFLFTQLNANAVNEDLGLNPSNDCKDLWRYTLFDNKAPNNYYIIKQRGVYIDTTRYQYPNAVIDKKYNLKHGSFSVVISP